MNIVIDILKDLRLTILVTVLAIAMVGTAVITKTDIVKLNLDVIQAIEKNQVEELLSACALIAAALTIDIRRRRKRHQAEIEAQKLRTLQATMRAVQDIVNNFLNNLLLFEMEVRAIVPAHSLDKLDELTRQTYDKLKALGDVECVRDSAPEIGAGIEYEQPAHGAAKISR